MQGERKRRFRTRRRVEIPPVTRYRSDKNDKDVELGVGTQSGVPGRVRHGSPVRPEEYRSRDTDYDSVGIRHRWTQVRRTTKPGPRLWFCTRMSVNLGSTLPPPVTHRGEGLSGHKYYVERDTAVTLFVCVGRGTPRPVRDRVP